jgi:DnaK suppressor protein
MEQEQLTDAQRADLKTKLLALRDELSVALERSKDSAQVVSLDEPIGRLSRMDAIQQQKIAEASKRQQELQRAQVEAALTELAHGTYGTCKNCDEPIGHRRLWARPETRFCLRCQGGKENA